MRVIASITGLSPEPSTPVCAKSFLGLDQAPSNEETSLLSLGSTRKGRKGMGVLAKSDLAKYRPA